MRIAKAVGVILLAVYLIITGLVTIAQMVVGPIFAAIIGLIALAAGILLIITCCHYCCCCRKDDHTCHR